MKGGMDLVVVKHHRCVENLVVSVGKRRKDEGNGTVDVGGGRLAIVLVPLAEWWW